ncbi:MAG: phospholipase D family protein [Deltaproteobacteria bacterium]|nr:phospholipase D family protein [Deltaproteobacteria bacterium]
MKTEKRKISMFCALLISYLPLSFSAGSAAMVVQACFSPRGKCSSYIEREINQAQKEILVAVYAFTSDDLAWALIKARQRGVKVQVVLDREFDRENAGSKGPLLEKNGLAVKRVSGANAGRQERAPGLMHQKFAVIDRKALLTGSYNWTLSADNSNDENLLLFRDAGPLAEEYRKEFFRLWEKKK